MSLLINVATGSQGLADSRIHQAITTLAAKVSEQKRLGNVPKSPSLEITFLLPGKSDKPSFTGMRMGGYTTKDDILYFEKSVPEHILHSTECLKYVSAVVEDAVDNANYFFENSETAFDYMGWRRFSGALGKELNGSSSA